MLELFVQKKKEDVEPAIVQFVARRSYRISRPWYLDGIRIEAPPEQENKGGFWSAVLDSPSIARIDLEIKRKRSGTRIRIVIANSPESTRLAYELHAYLLDPRSFDLKIPAICPRCSTPIVNVTARFCGRCGNQLVTDSTSSKAPERSAPPIRISPPLAIQPERVAPPIIRDLPAREATKPAVSEEMDDGVEVLPGIDLVDGNEVAVERDAIRIPSDEEEDDAEQSFERMIAEESARSENDAAPATDDEIAPVDKSDEDEDAAIETAVLDSAASRTPVEAEAEAESVSESSPAIDEACGDVKTPERAPPEPNDSLEPEAPRRALAEE